MRDALGNLEGVDPAEIVVNKPGAGSWEISFVGQFASRPVALLVGNGASLTGGSNPSVGVGQVLSQAVEDFS